MPEVEVVQGDDGLDAASEQFVDELVVEGDAGRTRGAVAVGDDLGPRDGEPVGPQAQLGEECHVLLEPVVVVGGYAEVGSSLGEGDPDVLNARPLVVGIAAALHMVGRGRSTPQKCWWERLFRHGASTRRIWSSRTSADAVVRISE
nr:hypothetical protein [Amycolatopsis methanolica]